MKFMQYFSDFRTVAICGGGGKSAILIALARELRVAGRHVLITTTTHLEYPEDRDFGEDMVFAGEEDPRLPEDSGALLAFWYREKIARNRRVAGFTPEKISGYAESCGFDHLIVECDGSRGRPLKVPGESEPQVPVVSDCVIGVIGLSALDAAAGRDTVHRMERFTALTGQGEGERISVETLRSIIAHPDGIFRNAPAAAERVLVLNQADLIPGEQVETVASDLWKALPGLSALWVLSNRPALKIHTYRTR